MTGDCHCGKDGHALGSVNCPVHGDRPRVMIVEDKDGLKFEAYELRRDIRSIFVDVKMAEICGGIDKVRNGISPYFKIVVERLI